MIPVITLKVFFANSDPGYPGDPGVHFKSFFFANSDPGDPGDPGDHFKSFFRKLQSR